MSALKFKVQSAGRQKAHLNTATNAEIGRWRSAGLRSGVSGSGSFKGALPEAGAPVAVSRCATLDMRPRCTVAQTTTTAYPDSTFVKALTSYTCALAGPEARALENYLREHGYEFRDHFPFGSFARWKKLQLRRPVGCIYFVEFGTAPVFSVLQRNKLFTQ